MSTAGKRFFDELPAALRATLLAQIRVLWTHATVSIEGNSFSLGDTQFVIDTGLTISGKPMREHNEVIGHARAADLLMTMVDKPGIDEADVFTLHRAILDRAVFDVERAMGGWKVVQNYTSHVRAGRQHIRDYVLPEFTPAIMHDWLDALNAAAPASWDQGASVYAALHLQFVTVHPFFDGNGRLARLLANLPLLKHGYPPIVVDSADKRAYLEAISDYQGALGDLTAIRALAAISTTTPEALRFAALCRTYWNRTVELVEAARAMAAKNPAA